MIIQGTIPEQIVYVYGPETKIKCNFSATEIGFKYLKQEKYINYTIVVGTNTQAAINNAKNKLYTSSEYDIVENKPISNMQIICLHKGEKGDRYYKMLINDKYYVTLKEDLLLEIIFEEGIDKGGIIKGEYIWANINNIPKLIRIGSEMHKKVLESEDLIKKPHLTLDELEPFSVYTTRNNSIGVFLGEYLNFNKLKSGVKKEKCGLFFITDQSSFKDIEDDLLSYVDMLNNGNCIYYLINHFSFSKSFKYKLKIGEINPNIQDYGKLIREYSRKNLKELLKSEDKYEEEYADDVDTAKRLYNFTNIHSPNENINYLDIDKYLLFV